MIRFLLLPLYTLSIVLMSIVGGTVFFIIMLAAMLGAIWDTLSGIYNGKDN